MNPSEAADNRAVEHQNDEKGDRPCQDSLGSVGKVPVDVLAILAGQNASTSVNPLPRCAVDLPGCSTCSLSPKSTLFRM
jgi:hypothetical protein